MKLHQNNYLNVLVVFFMIFVFFIAPGHGNCRWNFGNWNLLFGFVT